MFTDREELERVAELRASSDRCDVCSAPIPADRIRCVVDCQPRPLPPAWHQARQRLREILAGTTTTTDDEHEHDRPSDARRRMMFASLAEAGIVDRDDRLAFSSAAIGRTIDTSNEMTATEVGRVIDAANRIADGSLGIVVSESGWSLVAVETAGVRP
jgi:hypothetical protein